MDTLPFIDLKKQFQHLESELTAALMSAVTETKYIQGPQVSFLEEALAEYVGVKEVVACGNGTDALTLPLLAWDLKPGEAVFCPAFTFIATAEVIALRGATPVFVDIDPRTYNMDASDLARQVAAVKAEGRLKPRGVIPVDLFGLPADYPAIESVAKQEGLIVLEDAAQGFGGSLAGHRAGSFGQAAGTSFFPAKPLGCYGDGGAILTNDVELSGVLRSLRGHGAGSHKYEHVRLGLNSRLDTIQAAILLVKLKAFPDELKARQRVAEAYSQRLAGLVETPVVPDGYGSSWAQYTVRVPAERRDKIMEAMKLKGVPTMVYYPTCLHLQPAFAVYGGKLGDFPQAERASREVLSLPMHPYLEERAQEQVVSALFEILKS